MKLKLLKQMFIGLGAVVISCTAANAQCGCAGASIAGITPIETGTNVGVLRQHYLKATTFYKSGFGDKYYSEDHEAAKGLFNKYKYDFIGLNAGYGLTNNMTVELETGYFLNKMQDFYIYKYESSGFSHMNALVKYRVYGNSDAAFEYTAGMGVKMPMSTAGDTSYQNILPSTRAFGGIIHSFLYKGIPDWGLNMFLINRAEINTENKSDYKYGFSLFSSLFFSRAIIDNLSAGLEIRDEYRARDEYQGKKVKDSGGSIVVVSPQLNYRISNFNIAAMYDFPVYNYYYGNQLANSYSFGMKLTWQTNLMSEE